MGDDYAEHIEVLKTMYDAGLITRPAMRSLRGQVLALPRAEDREKLLQTVIKKAGRRIHAGQETVPIASH